MERISWLYYFQLDRLIFERESGVWQFYLRNRLFCKHKLLVIVLGNYSILNKHYTLEKMYKWLKIELSFFTIQIFAKSSTFYLTNHANRIRTMWTTLFCFEASKATEQNNNGLGQTKRTSIIAHSPRSKCWQGQNTRQIRYG